MKVVAAVVELLSVPAFAAELLRLQEQHAVLQRA